VELHLSRDEIVRQVRAHLGEQTNNALSSATNDQTVVAVQASAVKVHQDCRWVNAQGRVTVDLGIEQNTLNYPEGVGPGSVFEIGVFDGDDTAAGNGQYYRLEQRTIPVSADQDQQQIAGGDVFDMVQGRPRYFEQRGQIMLWPYSDKAYKVRIGYSKQFNLPLASSVSIVDAQLIIWMAASMVATQRENPEMARYFVSMYADRLSQLKGLQSAGTRFAMDSEADFGEGELSLEDMTPNWDRAPTIR
jgi:hypothetical protein